MGLKRPTDSFDFSTQPTLLPAVQISEAKWRMNDEIMMKQQADDIPTRPSTPQKSGIGGMENDVFKKPMGLGGSSFMFSDFGDSQLWPSTSRGADPSSTTPAKSLSNSLSPIPTPPKSNAYPELDSPESTSPALTRRIQRGRKRMSSSPAREEEQGSTSRRRIRQSSLDGSDASSPSVSPLKSHTSPLLKPKNAFAVMMSSKPPKPPTSNVDRAVVESYMNAEAEESDEEVAFGYDGDGKEEEEGDGGEQAGEDGHVKDLVDDQEMDEETLAKEKVMEKVA